MKLQQMWRKNRAEITALLGLKMPRFVYGVRRFKDIPVFCLHNARYPDFDRQLSFLSTYGYRTLDGEELLERLGDKNYRNDGKDIVLTFDDGLATVWTVAYPLLKRYNRKIISFILPGLIDESDTTTKNLDDCSTEAEREQVAQRDFSDQPLCNWAEIREMHESGLVDIQSHGMLHRLVSTSPEIVDFISPDYDVSNYGNTHVPVYQTMGEFSRKAVLGHPVYRHAPLLSQTERYDDPWTVRESCAAYVSEHGGAAFFEKPDWRELLVGCVKDSTTSTKAETSFVSLQNDMEFELVESRNIITEKLNKSVKHFCFPWFAGMTESAELAHSSGYEALHLGATREFRQTTSRPLPITRLQEEYLLGLPGYHGITSAFKYKFSRDVKW